MTDCIHGFDEWTPDQTRRVLDVVGCPACKTEKVDRLERFAIAIHDISREGGADEPELFDLLCSHGIIAPVPVVEPCGGFYCQCHEAGRIPGYCYRLTISREDRE